MSYKKKLALSISSWFCIPEQGMKDFEILCRGSAFLIPVRSNKFTHKFHVVTSSHVVAPFKWPNYYSADWLQAVNESHMHYTVEVRDSNGTFIIQQELLPQSYHHPEKDLAVLHIELSQDPNDENVDPNQDADPESDPELGLLSQFDIQPLSLFTGAEPRAGDDVLPKQFVKPAVGTALSCHGHEMVDPRSSTAETSADGEGNRDEEEDSMEDRRIPIPRIVTGNILHRTPHQVFARTAQTLTDGMCGGPIVAADGRVLGVCEGIVPLDHAIEALRGAAVYVESDAIAEFVEDIEQQRGPATSGLLRGEAWLAVGRDQDPSKMDLKRLAD